MKHRSSKYAGCVIESRNVVESCRADAFAFGWKAALGDAQRRWRHRAGRGLRAGHVYTRVIQEPGRSVGLLVEHPVKQQGGAGTRNAPGFMRDVFL